MNPGLIIHRKHGRSHAVHQFTDIGAAERILRDIAKQVSFAAVDFSGVDFGDPQGAAHVLNNTLDALHCGHEVECHMIAMWTARVVVVRDAEGRNPAAYASRGFPVEVELLDYSNPELPELDRRRLEAEISRMSVAKEFN